MVNAQAERLFGYDRDETARTADRNAGSRALPARAIRGCAAPSSAIRVSRPMGAGRDLYGLKKDGSEFPIEIGLNPIETEEGTMVLSAIVDITRRKRLEDALPPGGRVRAQRHGDDQRDRPDRDGQRPDRDACSATTARRCWASRSRCWCPERFRGQSPQAAQLLLLAVPISRPMGAGRDLYGLKKDGSEFPIEIGLNPIETDEGPMVLSAIVDISARKRLEERFRQVVESAPNAMVMIGADGHDRDGQRAGGEACSATTARRCSASRSRCWSRSASARHHPGLRGSFFAKPGSRARWAPAATSTA